MTLKKPDTDYPIDSFEDYTVEHDGTDTIRICKNGQPFYIGSLEDLTLRREDILALLASLAQKTATESIHVPASVKLIQTQLFRCGFSLTIDPTTHEYSFANQDELRIVVANDGQNYTVYRNAQDQSPYETEGKYGLYHALSAAGLTNRFSFPIHMVPEDLLVR
jgi:hypothetical protein